jgi:hypothetical protein
MTMPTEPGRYWAKCQAAHRPRGWFVARVVRIEGELYADDGRHVSDGIRWGPQIHPPDTSIPTESCDECLGRGWVPARPFT